MTDKIRFELDQTAINLRIALRYAAAAKHYLESTDNGNLCSKVEEVLLQIDTALSHTEHTRLLAGTK